GWLPIGEWTEPFHGARGGPDDRRAALWRDVPHRFHAPARVPDAALRGARRRLRRPAGMARRWHRGGSHGSRPRPPLAPRPRPPRDCRARRSGPPGRDDHRRAVASVLMTFTVTRLSR